MKAFKYILILALVLALAAPALAKGGPPDNSGEIPDTGELYGDLYVILRDDGGVPSLSDDGCIQPISSVTDNTTIDTSDGPLVINAIEGEPFGLPTYTDTAGDDVECELTADMADWVQAVDFGRLNLGRSPESVIAHAFDEAINKMNTATAMAIDPAGRLVLTLPDAETGALVEKTIDSPAENLALYIELMKYGEWVTEDTDPIVKGGPPAGKGPPEGDGPSTEPRPVISDTALGLLAGLGYSLGTADITNDELLLAASLLAAAADKTGSITLDKVVYINSVYGINQMSSLPGEVEGKTYFDFGGYIYSRNVFGGRTSGVCDAGWIWVLQPELDAGGAEVANHFVTTCMEILGFVNGTEFMDNSVHFTDMVEKYSTVYDAYGDPLEYNFYENVRAFTKAADDALQVLEYIHNYKVPEVLYP